MSTPREVHADPRGALQALAAQRVLLFDGESLTSDGSLCL